MENSKHSETVTLFVKVAAKAESHQKAKEALLADTLGARTEDGNYKMELYQANGDTGTFYLVERWRDKAALEEHFKKPYTKGAFDLMNGHLTSPIEMNYLTDFWPLDSNRKKKDHNPLTALIVPFEVEHGRGPELIALFEAFVPLVRQEKGNVEFNFHSVEDNENIFVLYERWENQADLDIHNSLESTVKLVTSVGKLNKGEVMDYILFAKDIS